MSKKRVLILCTGNSCRSIMAEALVNAELGECIEADSSGVEASGKVNPVAQALLEQEGLWRDEYHSKRLESVIDNDYDLIVTVCDHANESCPNFPKPIPKIHIGFEDPTGREESAYIQTLQAIRERLLPAVEDILCNTKGNS